MGNLPTRNKLPAQCNTAPLELLLQTTPKDAPHSMGSDATSAKTPFVQQGDRPDICTVQLQPSMVMWLLASTTKTILAKGTTASKELFILAGDPVAPGDVIWVPDWLPDDAIWSMGSMSVAPGFYDLVTNSVAHHLCDLVGSDLSSHCYQQGCPSTRVHGQVSFGSVRITRNTKRTKRSFAAIVARSRAGTMAANWQAPARCSYKSSSTQSDKHQATSPVREKGQPETPITRRQLNHHNSRRAAAKAGKRISLRQKDVHPSVPTEGGHPLIWDAQRGDGDGQCLTQPRPQRIMALIDGTLLI